MAVFLLARLGYSVTASTGRPEFAEPLRDLGAAEVVGRRDLDERRAGGASGGAVEGGGGVKETWMVTPPSTSILTSSWHHPQPHI